MSLADVQRSCPACHGRGYERRWDRDTREMVKVNDRCTRCRGVGHVALPSEEEVLEIAMRCAFGPADGEPQGRGVVDPETGRLRPGNYAGQYSDDGLSVSWSATKVEIYDYANTPSEWRSEDEVGPLVEYAAIPEGSEGMGPGRAFHMVRVYERTYTWAQLTAIRCRPRQLEFALADEGG